MKRVSASPAAPARIMLALVLVTLLVVMLAGCGQGAASSASGQTVTVQLNATNFVNNTMTYMLKPGQSLEFFDPLAGGGLHILCFGTGGVCDKTITTGPKDLQGDGFQIDAGESRRVTFATASSIPYPITCSVHPIMQITVVVQ